MTKIEDHAFSTGKNLTSVTIPKSVTSIGQAAFGNYGGLKDIYYGGSEAQWNTIKFGPYNDSLKTANLHAAEASPVPVSVPSFSDVSFGDWFAKPVNWAVGKGITSGTSGTTFSPDQTCTTAQILTFIWKAKGAPEPSGGNPFSDVSSSDYYYKAARWASEHGLVSGDRLYGGDPCTRGAAMEYLWKLAGSPDEGMSSFSDAGGYSRAAAWAAKRGITSGTSDTTFSPGQTCTRAQIMTFLYKNFAG